jgi:hypothetical protein
MHRDIPTVMKPPELLCRFPGARSKMASVALRMLNNFFGAHAWMACARALKLDRPRAVKRCPEEDRYLEPESGAIALQ